MRPPRPDRVHLRDLRVHGVIGVDAEEREAPRELVVNIALETDIRVAAASDDIADAIDYRAVAVLVAEHTTRSSPQLIETLAEELASLVLARFPVDRVEITVDKPAAVSGSASSAVEIVRSR